MDISFVAEHLYIASKFYPPDEDLPDRAVIIDLEPWFEDGPLQGNEPLGQLKSLAQKERAKGHNVVLQCHAGRNRSALIAALCLIDDGWPPEDAILQIRTARTSLTRSGGALTNQSYTHHLLYKT